MTETNDEFATRIISDWRDGVRINESEKGAVIDYMFCLISDLQTKLNGGKNETI